MELDFLDGGDEPAEDTAAPVVEPEGPARGPDGKFASANPEPALEAPEAVEPAPEPAPPVSVAPEPVQPGHVPLSAMLEERDKRKAVEERLRAIEAQQQQQWTPDPYEDPEGHAAWRDQQIDQRILTERLNFSERLARRDYGADVVDKARDWALEQFQRDPLYYQKVMSNPDPYEAVVQDYKRDQVFSQMQPTDLDAFLAWKSGQGSPQPQPTIPPMVPPHVTPPPRSLASLPSAGSAKPGETPVGPGLAFDAIFGKT